MSSFARAASFQNSGADDWSASSSIRSRLPAMSKMPLESLQTALQLRQAVSQGADFHRGAM
jgi:hypothetical protein